MKNLFATLMCLMVLTFAAVPAEAQTSQRRKAVRTSAQQRQYDGYRERSIWDKHRDKITTAGGAVGGAILGGVVGGKKGAVIGALAGGGGAAIYTYKVRKRDRRY